MNAVAEHLGIDEMSERQSLIFYGVSRMYLSMYGRWFASDRSMPLDDVVEIARSVGLHGVRKTMFKSR